MNKKQLERIKEIDNEIYDLMEQLYSLTNKSQVKGQIISDMPRGGERKDSTLEYVSRKNDIEKAINKLTMEKEALIEQAIEFISNIKDVETRAIIQKRIFSGETFEEIGYALGMDRSTVCRKFNNFFKKLEIAKMQQVLQQALQQKLQ